MSDTLFEIEDLDAYYGQAQVLEGVSLAMGAEGVAVIGRNGMGKTTLCAAVMGMMPRASGSIRFKEKEILGRPSYKIAGLGIGYVPQGRRLFPSLSVDEHLQMLARGIIPMIEAQSVVFPMPFRPITATPSVPICRLTPSRT